MNSQLSLATFGAAVFGVGCSFGAVASAAGLSAVAAVFMSLSVFAGAAQFAFVGAIGQGSSVPAALLAGLLLNIRLVPLALGSGRFLPGRGLARLASVHLLTEEVSAFGRAAATPEEGRRYFTRAGAVMMVAWTGGTALGVATTTRVDPSAMGLDAAFPAVLVSLLLPALRSPGVRCASATAGIAALLGSLVVSPSLAVLIGLVASGPMVVGGLWARRA